MVGCTAVSELICVRWTISWTPRLRVTPTGRHPRDQARCSSHAAHAAGADDRVAAVLAGSLVEDEVAADREADLGAVAAGAGGVQVEGHGRVRRPARTRSASRLDAHRRGIRATMSTHSAGTRHRS